MIVVENLLFKYNNSFELYIPRIKIKKAEKICLVGPSGSGKTTLLNLISGIYKPIQGNIKIIDLNISQSNENEIRKFRINNIGFIFQTLGLVDYLTVEYNILLPFYISSVLNVSSKILNRLDFILNRLNLLHKKNSYINNMSEGERQRVAIARAVINEPKIIIGDEPTGNLDAGTTKDIMELIIEIVEENNAIFICATHDESLLQYFDRVIDMRKLNKVRIKS